MNNYLIAIIICLFFILMSGMLITAEIIMLRRDQQRLIDKIEYIERIIK